MADKRYKESTHYEPRIIFPSTHTTTVKDRETGKTGKGESVDKNKSIERAYKDLREKQGK